MTINKLKHLEEWQECVGNTVIGKGLSYQCEIEQVVQDTYDYGFEEGVKTAEKSKAMGLVASALSRQGIDIDSVKKNNAELVVISGKRFEDDF